MGAFPDRLEKVVLHAATPGVTAGTATMTATDLAAYRFNEQGRLVEAFDPRLPNQLTSYAYDAQGHVVEMAGSGQRPWAFELGQASSSGDTNTGRLLSVRRDTLVPGTVDTVQTPNAPVISMVYDVPLTTTAGGPASLDEASTSAWGQTGQNVPTDATAIFPGDVDPSAHSQSPGVAWDRAVVSSMDTSGRLTNTSTPGNPARHMDATTYDTFGNTVRQLSPANRELALASASDQRLVELGLQSLGTAQRAEQLSSRTVFDDSGWREVESLEPVRVISADGVTRTARARTRNVYNQGRPANSFTSDLVTTSTVDALFSDGSAADGRVTETAYDWSLGLPAAVTQDAGSGRLNNTRTTSYDSQGRVIKITQPASSGNDAGATLTRYYSGGSHAVAACGNRPEWADLVCQTGPAADITGSSGQPVKLPTSTTTYDRLGQPTVITETSQSATGAALTRTTTSTYDSASRPKTVTVAGGLGTATPAVEISYDSTTGMPTQLTSTQAGSGTATITKVFDALGRQVAYTDADGATTSTTYDGLSRPTQISGVAGTSTTYSYDSSVEPRGLPTAVTDSIAGAFTGTYDADGGLVSQQLPGGVVMADRVDPTGAVTARSWSRDGGATSLLDEQVVASVHGQWVKHAGGGSQQSFSYDGLGRLTAVRDVRADRCDVRVYGFDANSNRTHLRSATGGPEACPAAPALGSAQNTFDAADRIVNAGYSYDGFGRTTQTPGGESYGFYTNDLVRSISNAGSIQTFTLDPGLRVRGITTTGAGASSRVNHYGDDSDSPSWVQESADPNGEITRYVSGLGGQMVASTGRAGGARLMLANLHGDVALDVDVSGVGVDRVFEADEYGNPIDSTPARYGWLGAHQRDGQTPNGVMLMGVRLYQPATGRFLQLDPVQGGNANAYVYPTDPLGLKDLDGKISRRTAAIRKSASLRWLREEFNFQIGNLQRKRFVWSKRNKINALYGLLGYYTGEVLIEYGWTVGDDDEAGRGTRLRNESYDWAARNLVAAGLDFYKLLNVTNLVSVVRYVYNLWNLGDVASGFRKNK